MPTTELIISWQAHDSSMPQPATEIALLQRLSAGDDDALRELYARHGQRIYAYALRITADPATAEDVVQHTLVTAWRTAHTFRGEGRVIAWLLGIVHHTALKALRNPTYSLDNLTEENIPASQTSVEEHVEVQDNQQRLRHELQRLSPEHRAVLDLVFYQGLSLNETAEVLQCPLGTVKSRLSYARTRLRGLLERTEEL